MDSKFFRIKTFLISQTFIRKQHQAKDAVDFGAINDFTREKLSKKYSEGRENVDTRIEKTLTISMIS